MLTDAAEGPTLHDNLQVIEYAADVGPRPRSPRPLLPSWPSMGPCPEPDRWFDVADAEPTLAQHLDECVDCRNLAAAIAQLGLVDRAPLALASGSPERALVPELVPVGTQLGRYTVRGAIGAGRMGIVLEAYDPQLDRTVALKLVRGSCALDDRAQNRVIEEARAMARLAHPNVVAIHELVEVGDERLIAMEYVPGSDLAAWLVGAPSTAQRLRVLLEAGRGLAAAHDAGLVHRDVKPSNILVGEDGRARMTDFGVAAFIDAAEGPVRLVGTHGYLAPEVAAGGVADARSDQYSFAVTAWETLFATPITPARRRGPATARVLHRALAPDPAARFASMHDLLRALVRASRRRRRVLTGLAVGASILTAAVAAWAWRAPDRAPTCSLDPAAIATVWSPARRVVWEQAMRPVAGDQVGALAVAIEARWRAWQAADVEVCLGERRGGGVPSGGRTCVESARRRLMALVQNAPSAANATAVATAISSLRGAESCATAALPELTTLDGAARKAHDEVAAALDEVTAITALGNYKQARDRLVELTARVSADDLPLQGELLYRRADAVARTGDLPGALALLEQALTIAERTGKSAARANTLLLLMGLYVEVGDLDRAAALETVTEAVVKGLPPDPDRTRTLASLLGGIAYDRGRYAEAEVHHREVVDLEAELAADTEGRSAPLAGVLVNLGMDVHAQGKLDDASALLRRSLAMFEATVGPDHPDVALPLIELAAIAIERKDRDEAATLYQRAIRIQTKALGPDHPHLSETLAGLARVEAERGRAAEALTLYRRAIAIATPALGPQHPIVAMCEYRIAELMDDGGQRDEALRLATQAVAGWDANGLDHPDAHLSRFLLATLLWRAGQHQRARVLATASLGGLERLPEPFRAPAENVRRWLDGHR